MKNIFSLNDFPQHCFSDRFTAADSANRKLNKLIESWPVVYGRLDEDGRVIGTFGQVTGQIDTHKARLAFVEEIKQAPEEYHYVESGFTVNNEPMYKRVRK